MADAVRIRFDPHSHRSVSPGDSLAETSPTPRNGSVAAATRELVSSAEREAAAIVAAATADIDRTIVESQQRLHLVAAQTQAMLDLLHAREREGRISRGLGAEPEDATSAQQSLSSVMQASHAELDVLSSEGLPVPQGFRFEAPEPVLVDDASEPESFARTLSRRVIRRGAFGATVAAAAILMLFAAGVWWGSHRTADEKSDGRPVATAGGADAATTVTSSTGRADRAAPQETPRPVPRTAAKTRRDTPAAAAPGAVTGNAAPAVRAQLTTAAERWLDAYYRGDRDRMAAASVPNATITDERTASERLPAGRAGVQRILDEATVQVFDSDALLTAKMIERSGNDAAGPTGESVAYISQIWTRHSGEWRLTQVRILSAAALERMAPGK